MVNSKDLPDALHRLSEAHRDNPLSSLKVELEVKNETESKKDTR